MTTAGAPAAPDPRAPSDDVPHDRGDQTTPGGSPMTLTPTAPTTTGGPARGASDTGGRPVVPTTGRLQPLGLAQVRITGGFWGHRQEVNRAATLALKPAAGGGTAPGEVELRIGVVRETIGDAAVDVVVLLLRRSGFLSEVFIDLRKNRALISALELGAIDLVIVDLPITINLRLVQGEPVSESIARLTSIARDAGCAVRGARPKWWCRAKRRLSRRPRLWPSLPRSQFGPYRTLVLHHCRLANSRSCQKLLPRFPISGGNRVDLRAARW